MATTKKFKRSARYRIRLNKKKYDRSRFKKRVDE